MSTWILRTRSDEGEAARGARLRLAVKDAIDVAGLPTTAGSAAVAASATAAARDAECVARLRTVGVDVVGKANLDEMCVSTSGVNVAFGTPVNPLDPDRIPGGSSSGSAVAVATGEADIGLGTDTGGSIRIPAACVGVVGLTTTYGRIPTGGVWPLATSLDTVGPIASRVQDVRRTMAALDPSWRPTVAASPIVRRLRVEGVDPRVDDAVDAALDLARLLGDDVWLPGWQRSFDSFAPVLLAELWRAHGHWSGHGAIGTVVEEALAAGRDVTERRYADAREGQRAWTGEVGRALSDGGLLALPTLVSAPPLLDEVDGFPTTALTAPFNLAGVPALTLPVPMSAGGVPAGLQLVGPHGSEEVLCATARVVEDALAVGDPGG